MKITELAMMDAVPPVQPCDSDGRTVSAVYFVAAPDAGKVKIGRSTNIVKRMAALVTMSPVPLKLVAVAPGGADVELAYHDKFADLRAVGEWFQCDLVVLQEIIRLRGIRYRSTVLSAPERNPLSPGQSRLTPAERSLRAQLAANARWSRTDRVQASQDARDRQRRKFENEVDPDRVLPTDERARRADNAAKAHMAALALKSVKARRSSQEKATR